MRQLKGYLEDRKNGGSEIKPDVKNDGSETKTEVLNVLCHETAGRAAVGCSRLQAVNGNRPLYLNLQIDYGMLILI